MTSTSYPPGYPTKADVSTVINLVHSNTLLNRQLAGICQINGLKTSGIKAELQRRIVGHIRTLQNDPRRFDEIVQSIRRVSRPDQASAMPRAPPPHPTPPSNAALPSPPLPGYHFQDYPGAGMGSTATQGPGFMASSGHQSQSQSQRPSPGYQQQFTIPFAFKSSPFYELKRLLADVKTLEPMSQHRNTVEIHVKAQDLLHHLTDPSMRIMVLSAAANTGVQDIAFPYQAEIKVNGDEVKANLRGLKNKPGSTRPVDITDLLRQKPATYLNTVSFTYALTHKGGSPAEAHRYYLCLYVCKINSVASLVAKVKGGNKISRQSVVQEISRKARDAEIVTTSQKMSLKCPLSYMRLEVPLRSVACKHIQCFDATSYLQLQEQGPQWICPICSIVAPFDKLAVDEYAREILANTKDSVEQVTIEPDGEWHLPGVGSIELPDDEENGASYIEDDDVIPLSDLSFLGRSTATPNRSIAVPSTPNTGASREGSSMPRSTTASVAGVKRSAPVIDLTLSDDDDDAPIAPPSKRPNLGTTNGWT